MPCPNKEIVSLTKSCPFPLRIVSVGLHGSQRGQLPKANLKKRRQYSLPGATFYYSSRSSSSLTDMLEVSGIMQRESNETISQQNAFIRNLVRWQEISDFRKHDLFGCNSSYHRLGYFCDLWVRSKHPEIPKPSLMLPSYYGRSCSFSGSINFNIDRTAGVSNYGFPSEGSESADGVVEPMIPCDISKTHRITPKASPRQAGAFPFLPRNSFSPSPHSRPPILVLTRSSSSANAA
jgi:hypothetical protein